MKTKNVYVPLAVDILHNGHINILKHAKKYGNVVVGLLTDKAIAEYKSIPYLKYDQRLSIIKNIRFVDEVIKQDEWDYTKTLNILKPDFFVHGNEWKFGIQKNIRTKVIKILKKWKGKLIEPEYTKNISSTKIKDQLLSIGISTDLRISKLKRLMQSKKLIRVLECHNALGGLIIDNLKINTKNQIHEFDAMWSSSLADSLSRGKPDNQSVDYSTRLLGISEILSVTTKPMIFDIDNGGPTQQLPYIVKALEKSGVSAMIMEDKIGLKKNSLFKNQKTTRQDSIKNFCKKIRTAKSSTINKDFLVISRIESLILGKTVNEALKRAIAYSKAGTDCIMIHLNDDNPKKIFEFAKKFSKTKYSLPLIAVPSTIPQTKTKDFIKNGFKVVIYANHLIRSSFLTMQNVSKKILMNGRTLEIEKEISPLSNVLNLIKG